MQEGARGRYVRSGCFGGTWPTIDIAMVSRGGRRRGGRGYTSYNIHASMINKLCYWSIGFYIPPLAGRPPCIPRTRPVPVATNAKRSYEPDICYSWGNKSQSAILQLCPKDAAGSLPRNKIAR